MANFVTRVEISADASKPIEELNAIVSIFLGFHPNRKTEILNALKASVEAALEKEKPSEKA